VVGDCIKLHARNRGSLLTLPLFGSEAYCKMQNFSHNFIAWFEMECMCWA
jgi:hypothetical protein